jgi:nucleotide-binding universal stress UspA family protein
MQHGLAVARHFGATLHFLHLVRPSKFAYLPEMVPAADDAAVRDSERLMDRLERSHQLDGIDFHPWVKEGEVSQVVGSFVREQEIDLLITGTHGRSGFPRLVLGSVAQEIFHYVRCPVLTVGPRSPGAGPELQLQRVLFSTDLSRESLAAIPYVLTAVEEWHAALDLLHVCSTPNPTPGGAHAALMHDLRARMDTLLGEKEHPPLHEHLLTGKPGPCVIDFATRHREDLIVLGLKPHRALYNGPFWSHAYEIVRHAPCPVLSVRTAPAQT